jgi:putative transcriptional regulator
VIKFKIDEVAKQRGIEKIQHLVNKTGLNYNTVHWLWLNRATRIDLNTLDKICRALSAQPGELMEWIDDSQGKAKGD